ncbi:hypothetical protein CR956_00025 [Candidatus Saccharibacteria bacterium]|nr:MAG: hypothetical protein CR956_00025 [Candidatus Saccharibacteria bacterium]
MEKAKQNSSFAGVVALFFLALLYGMTAIMARYFSREVGIFESWYIRLAISGVFVVALFWKKIDFRKFRKIGKKDLVLIIVRGLAASVIGTLIFTLSTYYTSVGVVSAMQVVPTTAILGLIILGEKIDRRTAGMIGLAFVGALMMVLRSTDQISFGIGELLSLASAALFSLSFVLRKLHTKLLNDTELAFATILVAVVGNYLFAGIFEQAWLVEVGQFTPTLVVLFVAGGLASALIFVLTNYCLSRVRTATVSVMMNLELVFGVIMGYLLYREFMSPLQFIGAMLILFAVTGMSYLETKTPVKAS